MNIKFFLEISFTQRCWVVWCSVCPQLWRASRYL